MKPTLSLIVFFILVLSRCYATVLTVTNTNDSGSGSLREALINANTSSTFDLIEFNIPGAGNHVITLLSNFPSVNYPVTLNGFSQPLNNDTTYSIIIECGLLSTVFDIKTSDFSVNGIKFMNNATKVFWLSHENLQRISITSNYFINTYSIIRIDQSYITPFSEVVDSLIFLNNKIYNTGYVMYFMSGGTGATSTSYYNGILENVYILNNEIDSVRFSAFYFKCGGTGYAKARCKNVHIDHNWIHSQKNIVNIDLSSTGNFVSLFSDFSYSYNETREFSQDAITLRAGGTGSANEIFVNCIIQGNYFLGDINSTVSKSAIRFIGNGTGSVINKLQHTLIRNNIIDNVSSGISIESIGTSSSRTTVSGLQIDSNNITNSNKGISLINSSISSSIGIMDSVLIKANSISNCFGNGFEIINDYQPPAKGTFSHFYIDSNEIQNCLQGMFFVIVDQCTPFTGYLNWIKITGNHIYNNDSNGIELLNYAFSPCGLRCTNIDHFIINFNSIHDNGLKGIHIYDNSDTINFNNFEFPVPVISSINYSNGTTMTSGSIQGEPLTKYALQFYNNSFPDNSGYGEGLSYLNTDSVVTDSNGFASFVSITNNTLFPGCISALATDQNHFNTSEFSNCMSAPLLSAEQNDFTTALKVYPNPADEILQVKYECADNTNAQILVTDLTGRVFYTSDYSCFQGNNLLEIPTKFYPDGLYFIRFNNVVAKALIKHR